MRLLNDAMVLNHHKFRPTPLPFQVSDPVNLHHEVARAGLKDIRVQTVTEEVEFQSAKHMKNWVANSNPSYVG